MSIAHLYGKVPNNLSGIDSRLASKTYIPGGVMLSSPVFAPTSGVLTGDLANGSNIKVFYTKIGNQVTISCKIYGSEIIAPATVPNGNRRTEFRGLAAVGSFNAANLGADIVAQMTNDLTVKDANNAGAQGTIDVRVPGLFSDGTGGGAICTTVIAHNEIGFYQTPALGALVDAHEYFPGAVSFLAQNTAIVV